LTMVKNGKKNKSLFRGMSCIRTFLTMNFSLSCFTPSKKNKNEKREEICI